MGAGRPRRAAGGHRRDDRSRCHVAIATEVTHDGEVLGRIECGPRTRGSLRPEDRERLLLLGRQAGLAAHNARLAGELAQQAAELAASRARIIEAEEAGRRRIQRDIHDGIQQDLVALIAHLGLAEAQCGRVPDVVPEALRELRSEAARALTELRDLASGIHPSVLGDRGIVEAIEARAARLPIGVTILADNLRGRRFPAVVESAVYFVVCEALVNAVKHSRADDVVVRLQCRGPVLELEVCDDGVGFAADEVTGTGLAGLSDRLEALNGSLVVESRPGGGTRLRGSCSRPGRASVSDRPARLRVVIAEDHYLVREGMRRLLDESGAVETVAAVGTAVELLDAVDRLRPDAVLTDIQMPPSHHMEGIEAAHRLRASHPDLGVAVLSQYADEAYAFALLEHGAQGRAYLLKDRIGELDELVRALREVAAGRSVIDPRVVEALVGRRARVADSGIGALTPRELDVLRAMAQGSSNAGIADALHMSESAIEKHVSAIFAKFGLVTEPLVHRRVLAVLRFVRDGPAR